MKERIRKLAYLLPRTWVRFLRRFVNGKYCYFLWLFPINRKKIVISSYYGMGYGDSGKYIVEEIKRQGLPCEIVWLVRKELMNRVTLPENVRTARYKSFRALFELATATVWIDNCRMLSFPPKRKGQYYIQLWHGFGVKNVEKAAETKLPWEYVDDAKDDAKITDLMISSGSHLTKIYKSDFWYNGEVLECGLPRNDILVQNDPTLKNAIRERLGVAASNKVLLYAPTFRNKTNVEDYMVDFDRMIENLNKTFGGRWKIFLRLHPSITDLSEKIQSSDQLINVTEYDDMQELLLIADAFMTDLSSCLFDYALMKKPIFLFCRNYDEYSDERGFTIDIRTLGLPLAQDEEQLLINIQNYDDVKSIEVIEENLRRFGLRQNASSAKDVVEVIKRQTTCQ